MRDGNLGTQRTTHCHPPFHVHVHISCRNGQELAGASLIRMHLRCGAEPNQKGWVGEVSGGQKKERMAAVREHSAMDCDLLESIEKR